MDELFSLVPQDWSDAKWTVAFISAERAKRWLNRYHYLGGTHAVGSYGVFCPDLVAVVSIGQPANRNGVASKFGLAAFPGNHEVTRVAVHPDAPRNAASRATALAAKYYSHERGFEWLFSYSDTGQGHHGGIYQAINSVYVGLSPARAGYHMDGVPVHIRTLANRYKCDGRELEVLLGRSLVKTPAGRAPKHTYILPTGDRRSRKAVRRCLEPYSLPYPKRVGMDRQAA